MLERYFWKIRNRIERYVFSEKWAARLRLLFVFSLTALLIVAGYIFFEDIDTWEMARTWRSGAHPLFRTIPLFVIQIGYLIGYGFRHAVIPLAVVLGAFFAAASYVQDIYELPDLKSAIRYLAPALFGFFYPRLRIEDGKKQTGKGSVNPLDVIGGPGYINIRPGNAVLFESLRSPSSVRSEGYHFITRFDTIREIVSLEDQHGFIEETKAVTKDGIEVIVRDIHYRYRLRTGREYGDYAERKQTNPYPYSVQAVKNMAYNRTVRSTGLTSWFATINLAIDSGITGYIKAHQFDHLTHPDEKQGEDLDFILNAGELFTLVVYGQLIIENAKKFDIGDAVLDQIFDYIVRDFSSYALKLHSKPSSTEKQQEILLRCIRKPNVDESRFGEVWEEVLSLKGLYEMKK